MPSSPDAAVVRNTPYALNGTLAPFIGVMALGVFSVPTRAAEQADAALTLPALSVQGS